MRTKPCIVMALSGGLDSTTLLGLLLEQGYEVTCVIFHYGSKHNEWENRAAADVVNFYRKEGMPVIASFFDISPIMQRFNSNLLITGGEIPEGYYTAESMKVTVVPGRNLIFCAIMAGLAESLRIDKIAIGVHQGDHYIYPDCRREFIKALDMAIFLSSDRKVEVVAPFLTDDKTSILKRGLAQIPAVPYHLTRTCYKNQELSCGKCGSCQERIEAFKNIEMDDPIQYA